MAQKEILYKLGVKGAETSKRKLGGVDKSTKNLMKSVVGLAGAYLGARGLITAIRSSVEAFIKQEDAIRQLETAIGRGSEGLQAYASNLQALTTYGDETILEAQALIGAFIREEEALKKATKATLDLAAAKGFDLRTAADLVGKTLGSSTNALTRYGIEVQGAAGSTERLESMIANVDKAFGGMAEAMADTTGGRMQQAKNAFGDMQEVLGGALAPTIKAIAEDMTTFIQHVWSLKDLTPDLPGLLPEDQSIAVEFGKIDRILNELSTSTGLAKIKAKELGIELGFWATEEEALRAIQELHQNTLNRLNEAQLTFKTQLEEQRIFLESNVGAFEAYAFALRSVNDEMDAQLLKVPEMVSYFQDMDDILSPEQSLALDGLTQISNSLIQATIYGQKFGQAVVSSLKAIAAQLLSQMAVYMLMNLFTGGAFGQGTTMLQFLGNGGRINPTSSIGSNNNIGVSATPNQTVVIQSPILVGTEEQAVRDQLIPIIERSLANA